MDDARPAPCSTTATASPSRNPPGSWSILAARSRLCVTAISSVSTAMFVGRSSGTLNTACRARYKYSAQPPKRYGALARVKELP